jgi:N-acyl-D-aspartate/D-glutamate deacylase
MSYKVSQGVATLVTGNGGIGVAPSAERWKPAVFRDLRSLSAGTARNAVGRLLSYRKSLYLTRMRDEAEHAMESMEKIFPSGRELGVPVPATHHKLPRATNCRKSALILPRIKAAIQCRCVAGLLSLQRWFHHAAQCAGKTGSKVRIAFRQAPPNNARRYSAGVRYG